LIPSQIRYIAPATFISRNAFDDTLRIVPIPIIASPETMKIPTELPSELQAVRRIPNSMEFEIASKTAGPGVKHIKSEMPQKRSQWLIAMMVCPDLLLRASIIDG